MEAPKKKERAKAYKDWLIAVIRAILICGLFGAYYPIGKALKAWNPSVAAVTDTAAGVLLGIVLISACYILTMWHYMSVKRKKIERKHRNEIFFIGFAIAISLIVRFAFFWNDWRQENPDGTLSVLGGISLFFESMYSMIGGMTFEGLPESAFLNSYFICLYYGVTLYAGLVALSIITVNVSYETYSWFTLLTQRKKSDNIYIFTTATVDTFLLANSIDEQEKEQGKKPLVIFAGNELEAFDKKNTVHLAIMRKGFIYWSYPKGQHKSKDKSVLEKLHVLFPNYEYGKGKERLTGRKISIFAMGVDKREEGLEAKNYDIVVDEVTSTYRAQSKFRNRKIVVHYYILTNNYVNYSFYERKFKKLIADCVQAEMEHSPEKFQRAENEYGINPAEMFAKCVAFNRKLYQVHVLSEALLASETLLRGRLQTYKRMKDRQPVAQPVINCTAPGTEATAEVRAEVRAEVKAEAAVTETEAAATAVQGLQEWDARPDGDNRYRIAVVGFGQTGQQAALHLYTQTAYVDESGRPSKCSIDVFDQDAAAIAGYFCGVNPYFLVTENGTDQPADRKKADLEKQKEFICRTQSAEMGEEHASSRATNAAWEERQIQREREWIVGKDFDELDKRMGFPEISFYTENVTSEKFLRKMQTFMGVEASANEEKRPAYREKRPAYRAVIFAIGKDELNISMANTYINYYKHACGCGLIRPAQRQIVYVAVRDEKNDGRLNWTAEDEETYRYLHVVPFGCREEMYSYNLIIDEERDKEIHCSYNSMDVCKRCPSLQSDLQNSAPVLGNVDFGKELSEDTKAYLKERQVSKELYTAFCKVSKMIRTAQQGGGEAPQKSLAYGYAEANRECTKSRTENGYGDLLWLECDQKNKQANRSAQRFQTNYRPFCESLRPTEGDETFRIDAMRRVLQLEHARWVRFQISSGMVAGGYFLPPGDETEKKWRLRNAHECIRPFEVLDPDQYWCKDFINILLAEEEKNSAKSVLSEKNG